MPAYDKLGRVRGSLCIRLVILGRGETRFSGLWRLRKLVALLLKRVLN